MMVEGVEHYKVVVGGWSVTFKNSFKSISVSFGGLKIFSSKFKFVYF